MANKVDTDAIARARWHAEHAAELIRKHYEDLANSDPKRAQVHTAEYGAAAVALSRVDDAITELIVYLDASTNCNHCGHPAVADGVCPMCDQWVESGD